MALAYLVDENLRGLLWQYLRRHNARGVNPLDILRVGDPADLPLGTDDAEILHWCERENRILISRDEQTIVGHMNDHIAGGGRCPGIFLVRDAPVSEVVEFLVCAGHASEPVEWENQVTFIP
jgi:hypothetical protein